MGLLPRVALHGGLAAARHILQLEDRRTAQLNRLTGIVDAGLEGPYKAGLERLKIATKKDTSKERVAWNLTQAEELFTLAFGNLRDVNPLQSAWAAVHLAVICSATGRRSEGLHWAELAHACATVAANRAAQEIADRADGRIGRLRLSSEGAEARVWVGATVLGAATMIIVDAAGALVIVGLAVWAGMTLATLSLMQWYRHRHLSMRDLKAKELADFLADIANLRDSFGERQLPRA